MMVLPGAIGIPPPCSSWDLRPLGILEASTAIIGAFVSAKASILALSSVSKAFCEFMPFSHTPRPQNSPGETSQGKATIGLSLR